MIRVIIAGSLLLGSIYAAQAFGLGLGNRFGHMGAAGRAGTAGPPPPACSNQLDFSDPCNSQYLL